MNTTSQREITVRPQRETVQELPPMRDRSSHQLTEASLSGKSMTTTTWEKELIEEAVENIMAESSREPDGERLWVKTSYELADVVRPEIEKAIAQTRLNTEREWEERIEWMKEDDRPEITEWLRSKDYTKGYNQALDDLLHKRLEQK